LDGAQVSSSGRALRVFQDLNTSPGVVYLRKVVEDGAAIALGIFESPDAARSDVVDLDHRWRDEAHYRDLHHRVRNHLVDRLQSSVPAEQERAFRDILFLHRHQSMFRSWVSWQQAGAATARAARRSENTNRSVRASVRSSARRSRRS
jgi:hypothetical protein